MGNPTRPLARGFGGTRPKRGTGRPAGPGLAGRDRREMATTAAAIAPEGEESLGVAPSAARDMVDRVRCQAEGSELCVHDSSKINMRPGARAIDHVRVVRCPLELFCDIVRYFERF